MDTTQESSGPSHKRRSRTSAGLLLALILVYIINLRSFGWTLEMFLQPQTFVQAFLVALGAALLAGLYPAWRLGRIPPALAVRAE